MNKIICAVPVYNEGENLAPYLEGLISQSLKQDWELVVCICDNNSTDNTKEILEKYSSSNKNIHVINNPIKGVCISRRKLQEYICKNFDNKDYYLSLDCEKTPYKQGFINKFINAIEESDFELRLICADSDSWEYVGVDEEIQQFRNEVSTFDDLDAISMSAYCYIINISLLKDNLIPNRLLMKEDLSGVAFDTIDDIIYLLYFFNLYKNPHIESENEIDYIDVSEYISPRITNKMYNKQFYNEDTSQLSLLDIKKNIVFCEIYYYIILNLFVFPKESIYKHFGENKELEKLVDFIKKEYLYRQKFITYELYCMIANAIWHFHRDYFVKKLSEYSCFELISKIRPLNDKLTTNYIKAGRKAGVSDEDTFTMLYDYFFTNYNNLDKFLVDYC